MTSYRFRITGKVQGVWYRKSIQQKAQAHGFGGYVKNLPDGSVEAGVTLNDEDFATFVAILEEGSPASSVQSIEQEPAFEFFETPFAVY